MTPWRRKRSRTSPGCRPSGGRPTRPRPGWISGNTLDAGHGDTFSVRMMYVHVIGEYARHNGHADLLREALDGVTGR